MNITLLCKKCGKDPYDCPCTEFTPVNLSKELENVLTIDGRGRPKKASLFLKLVQKYGIEAVMAEVMEFSGRKFF